MRASRIVSVPPSYVVVGDTYRYRVKASDKSAGLEMTGAPEGMRTRARMVEWTPSEGQSGTHTMSLRSVASAAAASATQEITVKVSSSTLRASGDLDPLLGGGVYSDNPAAGARMLGAGVYVPPRALAAAARMTVSELSEAPAMPNASGRASAVRFGPEGQSFDTPARVTLPLPEAASGNQARTQVYVYAPMTGRWRRVHTVALDLANGLAIARATHFSVYAAIEASLELSLTVAPTSDASRCPGGLIAKAELSSPLSELSLASVNNLPESVRASVAGEPASVQDLLGTPGFTGSVRVVQVMELVERAGGGELVRDARLIASTLYAAPDGSATVTHSDALGNLLASQHYPQLAAHLEQIAAHLRGAASAVEFATEPADGLGVAARMHLLYFDGDASYEPLNEADLGMAAVEQAPQFALSEALQDGDCDGVLDDYDSSDDRLVASIEASPQAVVDLLAGDPLVLQARVVGGQPSSESWSILAGEGGSLTPGEASAVFQGSEPARYLVSYRAQLAGQELEHVFAIDVAAASQQNEPPVCRPTSAVEVGRVGDLVPLSALLVDVETPDSALRVEWGLVDGETLVASTAISAGTRRDEARFVPIDAGNFVLGCRAFDGAVWGPVGRIALSVVPYGQNRAPTDLALSPPVRSIQVGGALTFRASAVDPDGDALQFAWYVDGNPVEAQVQGSESSFRFMASESGVYKVEVEVLDGKAPPVTASARVLVGAPMSLVDADMDGWTAGPGPVGDCDDSDPKVHPGAFDACGDAIDADCDGVVARDDCDGDGFTIESGDCNDQDARIYPQAKELCNGLDDDCNGQVDEGFSLAAACVSGIGACASTGKLQCASDGLSAQCTARPLMPTPEQCNGVDDDCNGQIDEGLVCKCTAEICDDRLDNDCDGLIDAADPDCCVSLGLEICDDGKDNDCDSFVDGQDSDCQGGVPADGCANPGRILLGQWLTGTFDNAKADLPSSCSAGESDLVFAFDVKDLGEYTLSFDAAQPFAWSIQQGVCDPIKVSLSELSCNAAVRLAPGAYFLVLEGGAKGSFSVLLDLNLAN